MTDDAPGYFGRAFRITVAIAATLITLWAFGWVLTRPFRGAKLRADQVQLRLVHWGDPREDEIVESLVEGFHKKYPGIRVERINPGSSSSVTAKVQTMVAAGTAPDVLQLGFERVAEWSQKGVLADLDPYIAADEQRQDPDRLDMGNFYTNVLDAFRFDGQVSGKGGLYGFAKDFTTIGFYYNKDLFRMAGVAEPSPEGWTWDEFITAARKIGGLPNCYGAEFVTWESMLRVYWWSEGAEVTNDGFITFDFNNSAVIAALDRLRGWFFEDSRALASAKTQQETGQEPFATGRFGMAGPYGRWKVPVYRGIKDFDWDFAPLPHAAGRDPANGIFTSAWAMSRHTAESPRAEAAWKLIRYLVGEEGQRLIAERGLAIPTMISVAESKAFKDPSIKPYNDDAFLNAIPYARAPGWPPDAKYQHQLRVHMEEVFKIGDTSVAEAAAAIQKQWEANRSEEREYPRRSWSSLATGVLTPLGIIVVLVAVVWWRRRPGRLALREELAGMGMVSPWVIGFVAFTAFPVLLSLVLAFSRWSGLQTLDYAEAVGWDNFQQMRHDASFIKSLKVTLLYAAMAVPLGQIVALLAAVLVNHEIRGIRLFRAAWYLPSVLAGVAIAILWKWVFHHEEGMLNALLNPILSIFDKSAPKWFTADAERWAVQAFVIMSFWSVGGAMMIYLAGLKGISSELYEAASIDGATWRHRFRHVTLPMLSPVIFFNTIMAIIASFQIFTQAYVMTGGGPGDATRFYVVYLYNQAFDLHEMGYASAMAWLLLLIILGLTLAVMGGSRKLVYYEALKN